LQRRYSLTAEYTYLLRICCLTVDVVSLFVSRSLPSNGSARYNILNRISLFLRIWIITESCSDLHESTLHSSALLEAAVYLHVNKTRTNLFARFKRTYHMNIKVQSHFSQNYSTGPLFRNQWNLVHIFILLSLSCPCA
jgi:hypothetical protein